jgi:hypoxanthine phosphoribosyltransferase
MPPRRTTIDPATGVMEVEWQLFGELSRALALKVSREFDPELVIGIANAGVIPGATIASILDRPFVSMMVSRRYRADAQVRETPAIFGEAPAAARGKRVLLVDETCDTGDTIRLARAALVNLGAEDVKTAVGFRTGPYEPDFAAMTTEAAIVLPWDRELLINGKFVRNPVYEAFRR